MSHDFTVLASSALARRTFAIVSLTIVTIVGGVLWFAANWSTSYVAEQMLRETSAATKQYGLGIFQRLDLAATALQTMVDDAAGSDGATKIAASPYFDAVRESTDRVASSRPLLRVAEHRDTGPRLEMIYAHDGETFIAHVSDEYLWQAEAIPADIGVAVFDSTGRKLFERKHGAGATLANEREDRLYQSSWELFLRERFDAGALRIEMSASLGERAHSLERFRTLLFASLLPLLAGMGLLASVLIRRSHRPLERLIAATRDIAAGRFDVRVEQAGDADSRELIKAFNEMTERIARQWRAMHAWSRIDQSILAAPQFDETIRLALIEGHGILQSRSIAVLLLADESANSTLVWLDTQDTLNKKTLANTMRELQELHANRTAILHSGTTLWSSLCSPWTQDAAEVHVTPILHGARLRGLVLSARTNLDAPEADALANQTHLGERLAVALTAYERDAALVRQANYDELTQLANRRHLQQFLAAMSARCADGRGSFALLFLDLDRFKLVNDAIGHGVGDQLLRAVANRLKDALPTDHFLARLGGDEFTVVIPDVSEAAAIERGTQRVLSALSEPFALGEHSHVISASIGIAVYPDDGRDAETLLRNADSAMYRAKRSGTLRYAFYEASMNASALERVRLERDLRRAIANGEFRLHYQPQVDLRSGAIRGAEALLRWNHPELGLLTPDRFLAVAEDTGLIVPIGEWLIETVCRQYRSWRTEFFELEAISFNASISQLTSPHFVTCTRQAMEAHHVPRGALEVEITESAFAHDIDAIERVLSGLRDMGVQIAIDDFGVGYSSLSYLQRLSFDVLKIDRSFIPARPGHDDGSLCESIIAMANALRKRVIAEGIETQPQAQFLRERGCYVGQGYLYARPLPAEAFLAHCRAPVAHDGIAAAS